MVTARAIPERSTASRTDVVRGARAESDLCDVLALVGHELRSPLTTLGAALDLLEEDADAPDAAFLLSRARREVRRLRLLFDASMRSTELVIGANSFPNGECDVASALEGLFQDLDPSDYGVTVTAAIDPDLHAAIDPSALTVVVHNLLANAFRHAKANVVQVTATRTGGEVTICVSDDGVGFTNSRRTASAHALGSSGGLGLFVVERLLRRFGGTLAVHSAPGEGTACSVRIPEAAR
jgi:signal transduction histidine kinase